MRGDNHVLAVTTTTDKITGETKPLFYFPVQVCKATDEREITFAIAGPSGAARKQMYVDSATGEKVEDADCLRGVRIGDEFKTIPQDAIDGINEATKIETMVAQGQIPYNEALARYGDRITGEYFLQSPAKGGSPKSYRILYESLLPSKGRKAKAIVTKRTKRTRQVLCIIYANAEKKCLMMHEVRFAGQLKDPDEQILAPQTAQVEQKQIDAARAVVDGLGDGTVALDTEADDALALRADLIEQAINGEALSLPTPVAQTEQADDLTAMLEASLAAV